MLLGQTVMRLKETQFQVPVVPLPEQVLKLSILLDGRSITSHSCMIHWLLCPNITPVPHSFSWPCQHSHCIATSLKCITMAAMGPAQGRCEMQVQDLLLVFGKERSVWDRNQRSSTPSSTNMEQEQESQVQMFISLSLAAFHHSLYLEITSVMLKIKCTSKEKFKPYKANFALVLGCVFSPFCINCQEVPI